LSLGRQHDTVNLSGSDGGGVPRASTSITWRTRITGSLALPVVIVMLVLVFGGSTLSPLFLQADTWTNILRTSSFVIIVACFVALVLIAGGIDLSVGASFLAGAIASAFVADATSSTPLAIAAGLAVGAAIGLLNGLLASWLMISPIIATLGTMFGITAIVVTLTGGTSIGPLPPAFTDFANIQFGPIPIVFIYALIIAGAVHVALEYTEWGTRIRAIGGNREAAARVGINVRKTETLVYVLTGTFSAFAGVLQASSLGSGSPTYGTGMSLNVIAAVVIGGVSIYGAIGNVPGVIAGSVLLSVITIGLVLVRVPGSMQDFFVGLVLIVAVIVDNLRRSRMFKASVEKATDIEPAV
jgi:ribose/xylose/arabinose/galactoside ABC-type transport system permease subunit